jgi:hypothetical protein
MGQEFPCTEQGILDAIAEGGGPHTFDCDGPTTVVTSREIAVDNDTTLDGGEYLTVDGNEGHRVFSVAEGVAAELRGLTVVGGVAAYPDSGGGILNRGQLRLSNSIVRENEAADDLECCRDPRFNRGGGISNHGDLIVVDSEVSANTAFAGAGIWNLGTLSVVASTLSGNTGAQGAGVFNEQDASANVANSTVSGIEAIYNQGILVVTGTIVDGSCGGAFASRGYNIESEGDTCGFDQSTDQVDVSADDLNLGPLQDNGGPTMTHALGAGSVAIDWIPAEDCVDADGQPLTTDQRGEPRPGGTMCDVGAFEVQP